MACPPSNVKFQLRRAIAANWTSTNPILQSGEPGVEIDTFKLKIGNGVTRWNLLPYISPGILGPQGIQGPTGSQGIQGIAGSQGIQGNTGLQGIQGSTGAQGIQGIQGLAGPQGIQGSTGQQGIQGIQGIQGNTGLQGIQGSTGAQGIQGIQGVAGPQGIQGSTGSQGIQGSAGQSFTILGSYADISAFNSAKLAGLLIPYQTIGNSFILLSDGSLMVWSSVLNDWFDAGDIKGPQGNTGPQGIQGLTGPQGIQGPTGPQGTQGIQGVVGSQGIQGNTGQQGATGSQGIQGNTGPQGIQGPTGPQGTQGIQGIAGSQGIQGNTGPQGIQGIQGVAGSQGIQGNTGPQGITGINGVSLGNVLRVDSVYGNDSTASPGGLPYLTVNSAVNAVTAGQTIWVMPGIYNLSSGITLPNGIALRGLNIQTCIIQMTGVTSNTALLTMGESCRVEDLTLILTSSGHYNLTGIVFSGTSSQTSKLRTSVLTVDNSGASNIGTSNVYGILFSGSGSVTNSTFSFNSVKGSTVNLKSNGNGVKRGVLISSTNQVSTRDTNIYVAAPSYGSTGSSYVGVETNDNFGIGSIQMRSTSIWSPAKVNTSYYSASDILQTTPPIISNPTYLASPGIQVGPGTDLVTRTAGGAPFTTYSYPTTIYYGLKGALKDSSNNTTLSYFWPGTQSSTNGRFPDPDLPAAFYRLQQSAILSGMSIHCNIGPANGNNTSFQVYRTPLGGSITPVSGFSASLTGTQTDIAYYNSSRDFNAGDLVHVGVTYSGNNSNTTHDITIQLDMF